jgi:hypothetical protein
MEISMPPANSGHLPAVAATVLATCLLGACSHVPVTSLLAMSRINFETTDLFALRAALRIPAAFQARDNRMVVEVMQDGRPTVREEFALERLTGASELSLLGSEKRAGTELVAYKIPDVMIQKFEALRAKAQEAKAEKRKGSLTIKLEPDFCYVTEPPRGSLVFSTYLRTSETRTYVPVLLDLDAFSQKEFAPKVAAMPKC